MKVTALIDDELIKKTIDFTNAKNTTEALRIVLTDYVYQKSIAKQIEMIKEDPFEFTEGFSAEKIRALNNKIT